MIEGWIQDLGMFLIISYTESDLNILEDSLLHLFLPLGIIFLLRLNSQNLKISASKAYIIDKLQGLTYERLLSPLCPCCLNTIEK